MASATAVQSALLSAVESVERQVDTELDNLEQLKDEDYYMLRKQRLEQMKQEAMKKQQWSMNGHGNLSEIVERQFFDIVKSSDRVCAIFFRPSGNTVNTPAAKYMDEFLASVRVVAESHLEAKFVILDAEKCPFLVDRLKIWMLPSIVLIKDSKSEHTFYGLDDFGKKMEPRTIEARMFEKKFLAHTKINDD